MRSKFKLRHKIIAAVNAAAVVGMIILTAVGSSAANAQKYNYAAERWKNDSKKDFGQVSCFFGRDAGFDLNSVDAVKAKFYSELKNASITPEEGKTLLPYAYSNPVGKATISGDDMGTTEADITAVGGYFFFFRDFKLLSGAFFEDDDLMKTGVVLDRQAAFSLYGSDNIAGKNLYINNVKMFVSGVIDFPETKAEKSCAGETPKAYISYDAAKLVFGGGDDAFGQGSSTDLNKVTCYECISPEPVENFAYNVIKDNYEKAYEGKIKIVNNADRFEPSKRVKALKKIEDNVVVKEDIVYPYWENASRITDLKLSFIYGARRLLLIIPIITLAVLLIKAVMLYNRKKAGLKKALADNMSVKWSEFKKKFSKKAAQTTEKES